MTPDSTNPEYTPPVAVPAAVPIPLPSAQPVLGYCRGCGVALTAATVRYAMGTMYCAEHVPAAGPAAGQGAFGQGTGDNPYVAPPAMPANPADVSPGLAFVLGIIPGVGAIYNGQYAKGLIHVVIFGFIIALQEVDGPLAVMRGFLIPAFVFYMAFEAMHTAKQRLAGLQVDEFSSLAPLGNRTNGFPVGPVLLIVAGVFLLLETLDVISIRAMMRWWPVGLIALGSYMLYMRTLGTEPGTGTNHEPR